MHIIGINGFKRTGKGETFKAVQTYRVAQSERVIGVGFSDKLKILAARALGFDQRTDQECIDLMDSFKLDEPLGAQFNIQYEEPFGPTPRVAIARPVLHELTGREYLQNMGSWGRKVFGDTFWIDQVLPNPSQSSSDLLGVRGVDFNQANLARMYPGAAAVCLTDTRYVNEAQRILNLGGVVWEVVRPDTASDGHDSEQVLDRSLVTRTIVNDGTLEDLYAKVAQAYAEDCH